MHNVHFTSYDENVNKKSVQNYWDDFAAHEDWQEGCSGLDGDIRWNDVICNNYDEARRWIESHDRGFYDQLAVMYRDTPIKGSKRLVELQKKKEQEEEKLYSYKTAHSIQTLKAAYVGCTNCGSKLNKSFLHKEKCPVCGNDLRSNTVKDTIKRYENDIVETQKQIVEETKKQREKNIKAAKIKWLVKVEYHT